MGARHPGVRVLVIEDDVRLHDPLRRILGAVGYVPDIVATAAAGLRRLDEPGPAPGVVLVDLGLPDRDGVDVIRELGTRAPGLPVLVLTVVDTPERILQALRAGACGYLLKESLGSRLGPAIDEVLDGGAPLSPAAARVVVAALRKGGMPAPAKPREPSAAQRTPLTARESEVLDLLARGLTYAQAADVLGISINTVRVYVRHIYEKLDVTTKVEAAMVAHGGPGA